MCLSLKNSLALWKKTGTFSDHYFQPLVIPGIIGPNDLKVININFLQPEIHIQEFGYGFMPSFASRLWYPVQISTCILGNTNYKKLQKEKMEKGFYEFESYKYECPAVLAKIISGRPDKMSGRSSMLCRTF